MAQAAVSHQISEQYSDPRWTPPFQGGNTGASLGVKVTGVQCTQFVDYGKTIFTTWRAWPLP